MPYYNFIDKDSEEEFSKLMSIAERDEFLQQNPNIKQQLSLPSIGDSVRLGITKPGMGHRELIDNMHERLGAPGVKTTNRQTY